MEKYNELKSSFERVRDLDLGFRMSDIFHYARNCFLSSFHGYEEFFIEDKLLETSKFSCDAVNFAFEYFFESYEGSFEASNRRFISNLIEQILDFLGLDEESRYDLRLFPEEIYTEEESQGVRFDWLHYCELFCLDLEKEIA